MRSRLVAAVRLGVRVRHRVAVKVRQHARARVGARLEGVRAERRVLWKERREAAHRGRAGIGRQRRRRRSRGRGRGVLGRPRGVAPAHDEAHCFLGRCRAPRTQGSKEARLSHDTPPRVLGGAASRRRRAAAALRLGRPRDHGGGRCVAMPSPTAGLGEEPCPSAFLKWDNQRAKVNGTSTTSCRVLAPVLLEKPEPLAAKPFLATRRLPPLHLPLPTKPRVTMGSRQKIMTQPIVSRPTPYLLRLGRAPCASPTPNIWLHF